MTRRLAIGLALTTILALPASALAYFPPDVGLPPGTPIPPQPFGVPGGGPLGEPEAPNPGTGPSVQTPEPATMVTALTGLALAAGVGVRKRLRRA